MAIKYRSNKIKNRSNFAATRKAILSFNKQSINLHRIIKCKCLEESCVGNMESMETCQLLSTTAH